jgi:heme-degrading monooxygenase HmoA
VIGRLFHGWTTVDDALRYEEHLRQETFPGLRDIDGYVDGYVLRRGSDDRVDFTVLTLWESLDAIRAFAGDDYETAVVPDAARRALRGFDERVTHYEVAIGPGRTAETEPGTGL